MSATTRQNVAAIWRGVAHRRALKGDQEGAKTAHWAGMITLAAEDLANARPTTPFR